MMKNMGSRKIEHFLWLLVLFCAFRTPGLGDPINCTRAKPCSIDLFENGTGKFTQGSNVMQLDCSMMLNGVPECKLPVTLPFAGDGLVYEDAEKKKLSDVLRGVDNGAAKADFVQLFSDIEEKENGDKSDIDLTKLALQKNQATKVEGSDGSAKFDEIPGFILVAHSDPIPEPDTWLLLATVGALLIVPIRRRRRRVTTISSLERATEASKQTR